MSEWIFDSLMVTTLLMAAILVIRRPVARIFGAGVAYALWLLPAARLLMPSLRGPAVSPGTSSASVSDSVRDSVLASIQQPTTVNAAGDIAASSGMDWTAALITLWLGGAALFFIIQMIRYASMRDELLGEAEDLGRIDGVRLVSSDRVAGPLAFGLFARYIAVPENFTKAYSPAEGELAIAHEMAHHKSGDLFVNLAAFIFLCLQWFNPIAWLSWSAFRFDQEAACDARVLNGRDSDARQAYGRALARTAFDGVPTFATALNSPKTIIERLRRLTMKDASKQRRSLGKLGILAAAAIILPLTATIVPAVSRASDEQAAEGEKIIKKQVKIVRIKDGDVVTIDKRGDGEGDFVKKVERDGKTFVFHTDKELDDAQVEKMIAEAEASRIEAEKSRVEAEAMAVTAEADRQNAEIERGHAEEARIYAEGARVHAEEARAHALKQIEDMDIASYIPEIDISEIRKNCTVGQPITTNISGPVGQKISRVKLVMCGKGQAKLARIEAIKGLREARMEINSDEDMPKTVRMKVIRQLDEQIGRMEKQRD